MLKELPLPPLRVFESKKKEFKIIAEINIKIEYLGSTQYTPTQPKRWTIVVMFGGRLDRGKFWSQLLRLFHFG